METRIKRYLTFSRARTARPSQLELALGDLDLVGVPYESTNKGRTPMFTSAARKREKASFVEVDPLAAQSFRYESAVAGTAPVFGETPIKGNGPIKLQTCRRLSSGELLVVNQDHDRTLSDIREGEYIIGKKEQRRVSRAVSIKLNSKASAPALRSPSALVPGSELMPTRDSSNGRALSTSKSQELYHTSMEVGSGGRQRADSTTTKAFILGPADIALPLSPMKSPSNRTSVLSKGEERSPTVQALWKAEYVRLVAIYGQDGAMKKAPPMPGKRVSVGTRHEPALQRSNPPPAPIRVSPALTPAPIYSPLRQTSSVDNVSNHSSLEVPSLVSEESLSSQNKDTSLSDTEAPTTREEVSKIVETMRKNYLTALEANVIEVKSVKRVSKHVKRASCGNASSTSAPAQSKTGGRQSWHGSPAPAAQPADKSSKPKSTRTKPARESNTTPGAHRANSSKSISRNKALHRADSTTLGTTQIPRQDVPAMPANAAKLKTFHIKKSNPTNRLSPVPPPTPPPMAIEQAMIRRTADHVPDIDDLDIFYQDLAKDMLPTPGKPKPRPTVWDSDSGFASADGSDSAPAPPDIDWNRRGRPMVVAAL